MAQPFHNKSSVSMPMALPNLAIAAAIADPGKLREWPNGAHGANFGRPSGEFKS
jgi:hypothetical protein